jgi:hypothetical protein
MRISEIESHILENTKLSKELQKQVSDLTQKNSYLSDLKQIRLLDYFREYIELETNYTFTTYAYLSGVQTGIKTGGKSPNFQKGDVIRFDKRNKKSFVVTCLNKVENKFINGNKITTESTPNWTFRVEIDSLYKFMIRGESFKERFSSYVKRKESLELLGI